MWCHWDEQDLGHLFLSAMTAAERIECEDEEEQQPEQQEQEQKSKQAEDQQQSEQQEQDQKTKQADEQQQDEKEDTCTTVETTVQVNSYTEEDGVVTQTNHEEAKITQTFIPQEPEPEGPDESVLDGKVCIDVHFHVCSAGNRVILELNGTLCRDFVLFDFPSVVLHTMSNISTMVHPQR